MSFFGSRKKSSPAPAPQPRPVPNKIAATTPDVTVKAVAAEETKGQRQTRSGPRRRATKLTGPRGLEEEARTRFKTLLGV